MSDELQNMLDQRKQALGFQKTPPQPSVPGTINQDCFCVQAPQGFSEHFLDFRFQDGSKVAFPYVELTYINYDASDSRLDLNFRGFWVSLFGQNLADDLYENLRDCRVRWIAEARQGQSVKGVHIERIEVLPPNEEQSDEIDVGEEEFDEDEDR